MRKSDYEFLYELALSEGLSYRWQPGSSFPSFEVFTEGLAREPNAQFVVVNSSDQCIGFVIAHSVDFPNGTCTAGIVMSERYVGTGIGVDAAATFANYLFAVWNFRKIYARALAYTLPAYKGAGRLFREEGVLKAHRYYKGRYWDEHILAIYREDWEAVADVFLSPTGSP